MANYSQRCQSCGQLTQSNVAGRFCTRCGSPLSAPRVEAVPQGQSGRSVGAAYGLWALCLVGVAGLHRFYAGKPVTGILWLVTWGFLGLGSLFDLLLIPGMIERANFRRAVGTAW